MHAIYIRQPLGEMLTTPYNSCLAIITVVPIVIPSSVQFFLCNCNIIIIQDYYSSILCIHIAYGLFFNNDVVPNHGIVTLEDIGTSTSTAVQCQTTVADCCTDSDTHTGQWFFPDDSTVSTTTLTSIYQVQGQGYVNLQRNSGGAEGIYRCAIGPVGSGEMYYVGVYSSGNGKQVVGNTSQ